MSKVQIIINENPNPQRPDLREWEAETIEEFLARGGKIKKLPSVTDIWAKWIQRELLEEKSDS